MMSFNLPLLTNMIVLITFAVALVAFGACIMMISYKNNAASISVGNFVLHIVLAIVFYVFFSILALGFSSFNGVGNSVCIAFLGILSSRYAFSFSKYLKAHKIINKIKVNKNVVVKPIYSRNMPYSYTCKHYY